MKTAVISYSYTGNNDALANSVARELTADHIQISEKKPRTMGTIALDMLISRTPKVNVNPDILKKYDMVLFFAPIWMGYVASPLRSHLKYLKKHPQKYGFFSISGGADSDNPKLKGELKKRTGAEPEIYLDLHIADLLSKPNPTRKDTSAYKLNDKDIKQLTDVIVKEIKK
ncbi:MAG: hypothetical protein PWQ77_2155 [Kosmotogales bacterium]|nr:hypothetical protein [Kosmotogales bacterium]